MENFEQLVAWQQARKVRNEVRVVTKSFPEEEKWRLADQIIRSSRSVTANIAEGNGRFNYKENVRFCRIARGSLTETLDHVICAYDNSYIDQARFLELRNKISENLRTLNGYISFLRNKKD